MSSRNETQTIQDHCKFVREKLVEKLGLGRRSQVGLAALPLLAYLRHKGYGESFIVYGKVKVDKGHPVNHYWVEWNDFVLDIMADQFNPSLKGQTLPDVLVAPYSQLCDRYKPVKKDAINLEGDESHYLREWMKAE